MDALNDFAQKDMIEQITILDEIKEGRQIEAIPQLMEIYAEELADQAVDEMVYHALFELLAGQEEAVAEGVRHPSERIRLLCVRQAADDAPARARESLIELANSAEGELLAETLRALASYRDPQLIDVFLPFLRGDDYAAVAWAMEALVAIGDVRARAALEEIVETGEKEMGAGGVCDLLTAMAVEHLAKIGGDEVIAFLIKRIHHPNPSFRRTVITSLASLGKEVLPSLEECLEGGDKDEKIMAANIIGLVGDKQGADILIGQLEKEGTDANLRFAMYEALGRINSIRSVIGLSDGLNEGDEMVLMAVITGMDNLSNPGIVKVLGEALARGDEQSRRIARTIVTGHATRLFAQLYSGGAHADALIDTVLAAGDRETVAVFRELLEGMEGERAASDSQRLTVSEGAASGRRVLAADDSKAILFFYKGVAKDLGLELTTVADGKEALDLLKAGEPVDLLITDMNMPNMDGVELTREVRKNPEWAELPILMATTESEKGQADIAREAGVDDFISKPFTGETLKEKIDAMLS